MSLISEALMCKEVALGKPLNHEYEVDKGANCWLKNTTGDDGERSKISDCVVLALNE